MGCGTISMMKMSENETINEPKKVDRNANYFNLHFTFHDQLIIIIIRKSYPRRLYQTNS